MQDLLQIGHFLDNVWQHERQSKCKCYNNIQLTIIWREWAYFCLIVCIIIGGKQRMYHLYGQSFQRRFYDFRWQFSSWLHSCNNRSDLMFARALLLLHDSNSKISLQVVLNFHKIRYDKAKPLLHCLHNSWFGFIWVFTNMSYWDWTPQLSQQTTRTCKHVIGRVLHYHYKLTTSYF